MGNAAVLVHRSAAAFIEVPKLDDKVVSEIYSVTLPKKLTKRLFNHCSVLQAKLLLLTEAASWLPVSIKAARLPLGLSNAIIPPQRWQ